MYHCFVSRWRWLGTIFRAWAAVTPLDPPGKQHCRVTFDGEEGFAEGTTHFIAGFHHVLPLILFGDPQHHQGADSKVVCAEVVGISGEVSAVLVPCDFWWGVASNGAAHATLAACHHHVGFKWHQKPRRLVLVNSPVFLWFHSKFSCEK